MARRRGRGYWEKLVGEVQAGASQVEVARRHGVSQSWLGSWCRRLHDEKPSTASLLPVRLVDERARRVDIVVGSIRLSFEAGTDPAYVAALVGRLGS